MSDDSAMQAAQQKVQELLDAAKEGSIIPIRLPGQIEEIAELLKEAEDEHASELFEARKPVAQGDLGEFLEDEAEFIGHAVHELRTPMTSIRGYVDMLGQMGELNDMQKQFLGVVKTNTRRMEGLISDVRYMNKLRTNSLNVQPKMDMFKNIAMKIEKETMPRAEELNRQLEFDIPQGLPLLNVDGELLTLAITKLVENGLQYSPEGDGKVIVSAEGDDGWLVIHVADNGIGMTDDDLAQLGTVYFRSEHDLVREYKGSGLGIPIALGLLDTLGATIDVDTTPDEGTTFTVRIKGMS